PGHRRWHSVSLQNAGHCQAEGLDRSIELRPIVGEHLVAALHGTDGRLDHGTARIAKTLTGLEVGLLADHAITAHFLDLAVGVGDHPVACHQPRRDLALVADSDGVGEHVAALVRVGLLIEVAGLDVDTDAMLGGAHGPILPDATRAQGRARIASTSHGAACSTVSSVKFTSIDSPCRSRLPSTMRSICRSRATRTISALTLPVSTWQAAPARPSSVASAARPGAALSTTSPSSCTAGMSAPPTAPTGPNPTPCSTSPPAPKAAASA